jgi:dUTPase
MPTAILIDPKLQKVLDQNNVTNYGPAYNGESVGLDLYYVGDIPIYWEENTYRLHTSAYDPIALIPTGLKIKLSPDNVGLILERGSVTKTSLVKRAGVIDPGYTGEVFVNLVNLGGQGRINPGDKLPVQLVVLPCDNRFVSVTPAEFDLLTMNAARAAGKVGSSN